MTRHTKRCKRFVVNEENIVIRFTAETVNTVPAYLGCSEM